MLDTLLNNLPESPNILSKDRFINSAVLVPFLIIDGSYHLLFQKRAENIRQGSEICFPGGIFEVNKDDDLKSTALRETCEELGIPSELVSVKGQLDTLVTAIGVTVDSFVSEIDIDYPDMIILNRDEVERAFVVPLSYFQENPPEHHSIRLEAQPYYTNSKGKKVTLLPAKELGLPERYHNAWGGIKHRVLVYHTDEGIIWGVTAEIIFDIVKRLG